MAARFRHPWRSYQARVLGNLDRHLEDRKLHIIAPPGSGKTVLGLEILRRIGKPGLVLSPTIAIRDQWIVRWREDFLDNSSVLPFDSHTYQSIFSRYKRGEASSRIEVLVVDEAHHLRKEWWKALDSLVTKHDPIVVALTATPPWDVVDSELQRYFDLCGTVDEEIFVPELVRSGDLCPHQDYIHISLPNDSDAKVIREFRDATIRLVDSIPGRDWIQRFVQSHPFLHPTQNDWEEIYRDPHFFFSLLSIANQNQFPMDPGIFEILRSEKILKIPAWNFHTAEALLLSFLTQDPRGWEFREEWEDLKRELRRQNLLKGKSIDLTGDTVLGKFLSDGPKKIESIREIVDHEYRSMGENLRLVILADHLRREFLGQSGGFSRVGTVPIYLSLWEEFGSKLNLCHITGSLVLVPGRIRDAILQEIPQAQFQKIDPSIMIWEWIAPSAQALPVLTRYLMEGKIFGIVGTMSLLGEGWDVPAINSLVLASSIGSYMLSNQSRGRAIRSFAIDPKKTANIWHLAFVDLQGKYGGKEFCEMERRFRAFAGPSFQEPIRIETGLNRMGISTPRSEWECVETNRRSFVHADDRKRLVEEWKQGIASGTGYAERLVSREWAEPRESNKSRAKILGVFGFYTLVQVLLASGATVFQNYIERTLFHHWEYGNSEWNAVVLCLIPLLALTPRWGRALRDTTVYLFWKNTLDRIGKAVRQSLVAVGHIEQNSDLILKLDSQQGGSVGFLAQGGLLREREAWIRAMQEILEPPMNPRYLLKTSNLSFRFFGERYLGVPEVFGRKKETAEIFRSQWEFHLGGVELCYTRTPKGRKTLFLARLRTIFRRETNTTRGGIWI